MTCTHIQKHESVDKDSATPVFLWIHVCLMGVELTIVHNMGSWYSEPICRDDPKTRCMVVPINVLAFTQ